MAARLLENVDENPCFGCGPKHPTGLRLAFALRDGEVEAILDATHDRQGWPGRLHSGLVYLALLETANWTLYGVEARVGVPVRTTALDLTRWVAVGERLSLRGRVLAIQGDRASVVAEALDAKGMRVAGLERTYDLLGRDAFLARMGYDAPPAGLEDCLPE